MVHVRVAWYACMTGGDRVGRLLCLWDTWCTSNHRVHLLSHVASACHLVISQSKAARASRLVIF